MKKNILYNQSGIAAVEFAFIVPILLTLLIGVIDFGFYVNNKMKLETVSRAAAEYLIVTRDEDAIVTDVIAPFYENQGETNWESSTTVDTEFVCECEGGVYVECDLGVCEADGDYKRRFYEVSLSKTHDTLFVYPGFAASIELNGYARMQLD